MVKVLKRVSFAILTVCSVTVGAENINWLEHRYTHFSKEEPLKNVLESIAAEQEVPIIVSDKVEDKISVYFKEKKLKFIFDELVLAHGLISFYDEDVLYVYKAEETNTAIITPKHISIFDIEKSLRRDGLLDKKTKWVVSEETNTSQVSGSERFISIILKRVAKLDKGSGISVIVSKKGIPCFSTTKVGCEFVQPEESTVVKKGEPTVVNRNIPTIVSDDTDQANEKLNIKRVKYETY